MKSIFLALCLTAFISTLFAQADSTKSAPFERRKKSLAIVTGYYYYGSSAGELGFGKKTFVSQYPHPFSAAVYVASEFFYDKKLFVAPKVGAWFSGGSSAMNIGLSLIDYTNFNQSSLELRPEIGVGFDYVRIYYGRDIRLANINFNLVSKNLLGINLLFDVKKLHPKSKIEA